MRHLKGKDLQEDNQEATVWFVMGDTYTIPWKNIALHPFNS